MFLRLLKNGLISAGILILILGLMFWVFTHIIFPLNNPKEEYLHFNSSITPSEGEFSYVLFSDCGGFRSDNSWYILKLENNIIDVNQAQIPCGYMNGMNDNERKWLDKTIMWHRSNYGNNERNPYIEIVNNKYLVFNRGGYYYGLYDVVEHKLLVDFNNLLRNFKTSVEYQIEFDQLSYGERKERFNDWEIKNIHNKIKDIIEDGNVSNPASSSTSSAI